MKTLVSSSSNSGSSSGSQQTFSQLMAEAVIMGDPLLIARETLKTLRISPENYQVLSKKIQYASTLRSGSSEYGKTMNWIKHALSYPWPKHGIRDALDVPTLSGSSNEPHDAITTTNTMEEIGVRDPNIHEYIHRVRESLNQKIYGLEQVKEELLTYVCKRISNPNASDHVLALQGPNGVGKCLGKDTMIRLSDMSVKPVQDLHVGDQLMGDDGTSRVILSTTSGHDVLYQVYYVDFDQQFICNGPHILCLKDPLTHEVVKVTAEAISKTPINPFKGFIGTTCYPKQQIPVGIDVFTLGYWYTHFGTTKRSIYNATEPLMLPKPMRKEFIRAVLNDPVALSKEYVPEYIMRNHIDVQTTFIRGILSRYPIGTSHVIRSLRMVKDIQYLCATTCTATVIIKRLHEKYRIYVKPFIPLSRVIVRQLEMGEYYGFTLDGNCMFQLEQGIVTHNTRIAHSLSQSLNVPFRSISLGTVTDVSYLSGHGYTYHESEPGRIVQILTETQNQNTIIYFDELDKVHQTEKGQAIQSFLTHLIDPSQNSRYHDTYLNGLDLDLSKVLFVFSFNDESLLDRTVKDRLKIIRIAEPSRETKIEITRRFLIPEASKNVGLNVTLDKDTIEYIVRHHGNTNGLRNIKRVVEDIVGKINVLRLMAPEERNTLTYYRPSLIEMIHFLVTANSVANNDTSRDYNMMYS